MKEPICSPMRANSKQIHSGKVYPAFGTFPLKLNTLLRKKTVKQPKQSLAWIRETLASLNCRRRKVACWPEGQSDIRLCIQSEYSKFRA